MGKLERKLAAACAQGDLDAARAAIEDGAELDEAHHGGLDALRLCAKTSDPLLAVKVQLAYQRKLGAPSWRSRDGSDALSILALRADPELMERAAALMPSALFSRDADGRSPFDLFCESCCALASDAPSVAPVVAHLAQDASDEALSSAVESCRLGVQTAEALSRGASRRGSALDALQAQVEARALNLSMGPGRSASRKEGRL